MGATIKLECRIDIALPERTTAWAATDRDVGVPVFVVMELVQDARNADEVQKALALVDSLEVVWPSEAECQTALEQFSELHLSHGLGLLDALIAATAVGHAS